MGITWGDQIRNRIDRRMQLLLGRIMRWRGARVGVRFGMGRGVRLHYPAYFEAGDDVFIGDYAFLHCLCARGVRFGNHTNVSTNLWLSCGRDPKSPGFFEIGEHSFIGPNGVMGAGGGIVVGSHVQMGPGVTITSEDHVFDNPELRIDEQGVKHTGVVIEDDCWIGGRVTILDGVRIGHGSVIGSGAVVTRSIPPFSVAVGVPAHVIGNRR